MNNKSGRFINKDISKISNSMLEDNTLSLKAKGLYSVIKYYITLDGYTLYKKDLMERCLEGQKAFDSAWKELKAHGYLKQYRLPMGDNGTFIYEYELLDVPDLTTPALVNCDKDGKNV